MQNGSHFLLKFGKTSPAESPWISTECEPEHPVLWLSLANAAILASFKHIVAPW
jgi:hypothetical protein